MSERDRRATTVDNSLRRSALLSDSCRNSDAEEGRIFGEGRVEIEILPIVRPTGIPERHGGDFRPLLRGAVERHQLLGIICESSNVLSVGRPSGILQGPTQAHQAACACWCKETQVTAQSTAQFRPRRRQQPSKALPRTRDSNDHFPFPVLAAIRPFRKAAWPYPSIGRIIIRHS
jgi:hypothetical protein